MVWREVLLLALLMVSAGVALLVRRIVSADTLSDGVELGLTAGALATLAAAFVCAMRHGRRLAPPRGRVLRTIPLGVVLIGAVFVEQSYADFCVEAEGLIQSGREPVPRTLIALGPGGGDVRLAGEIRDGAATQLAALLDAHPAVRRIHLTSEGGLADEGQALGSVIAAHGLATYVPDFCVSACTLAFEGGRQRVLMRGARLGFHAPYAEGLFGQAFRGDASATRAAYAASGLSADFIETALEVGADDMWYPEPDRLLAAHAVTEFVDRYRYPDSNLDGDPTRAGARATVLRNFPILADLNDAEPSVVNRIAGWYLEAYSHAWSEGRVVDDLHALADSAVALVMAGAPDKALVDLARFADAAMQGASPRDCLAIGARGDLVTAADILEEDDPDAARTAAGLVGAASKEPRIAPAPSRRPPRVLIAFDDPPTREAAISACAALRRTYAAALAKPTAEAAALLRPRFAAWAQRSVITLAAAISEPSVDAAPKESNSFR